MSAAAALARPRSAGAPAMSRASLAERRMHMEIGGFRHDPLGYVLYAFPWGMAGTALADEKGPEPWQRDILERLGKGVLSIDQAFRAAIASGHGIGKSALVCWIILWALSTLRDSRGIVTANTEAQVRGKTWPELAKWHRLAINRDWFTYTATSLYSNRAGHEKTWRCDAVTWSENHTEAIQGLHNKGRRAFAIFDEASAIPDLVWDAIEGALTDDKTELFWCVFGNPTRSEGRFRECFAGGRFAKRWDPRQIDSRTVSFAKKAQIAEWVEDYGEDSDFVRVRVKGEFPRLGDEQFIDEERVRAAATRTLVQDLSAPLIMGVDVARSLSGDQSVIRFRRGPDARSLPAVKLRIPDLMQIAGRCAEQIDLHKPDAVFVDMTGLGSGVVDRLHQLGHRKVVGIHFGEKLATGDYANMRAKMWGGLKDWLKTGCLPDEAALKADMTGVRYGYDARNAFQLEKKEDMRKRGLESPDEGDALALTFAMPVARRSPDDDRRLAEKMAGLRRRVV